MVEQNKGNGQAGAAILGGAAGAAAGYLFGARQRTPAQGVPGAGVVALDDASLQALLAVSDSMETAITLLRQLIEQQASGQPVVPSSGNYGINQPHIKSIVAICANANQNYQLPDIIVPEGHSVVIKALFRNGGVIYVTPDTQAMNMPNNSYPLLANEVVQYRVQNTINLYIAATLAGEGVAITVEQAARGG